MNSSIVHQRTTNTVHRKNSSSNSNSNSNGSSNSSNGMISAAPSASSSRNNKTKVVAWSSKCSLWFVIGVVMVGCLLTRLIWQAPLLDDSNNHGPSFSSYEEENAPALLSVQSSSTATTANTAFVANSKNTATTTRNKKLRGFSQSPSQAKAQPPPNPCRDDLTFQFNQDPTRTCLAWVATSTTPQQLAQRCQQIDRDGRHVQEHCGIVCRYEQCTCTNHQSTTLRVVADTHNYTCRDIQQYGLCTTQLDPSNTNTNHNNTSTRFAYEVCPAACNACAPDAVPRSEYVIGGLGAAGMGAAYTLETVGHVHNYRALEAKEDVGGKIWSGTIGNFTIETGAGYMSGGVENPFYCQMKHKFEPEFETQFDGFNVAYKLQFNDDTGRKIPGVSSMYPHQGEDYFYNYDSEETPADDSAEAMRRALETGKYTKVIPSQPNLEETPAKTFAEAMGRAYDTGQWYALNCLDTVGYNSLSKLAQRDFCDRLCNINITVIPDNHTGIEAITDLVKTEINICNNTGIFTHDPTIDVSMTDLMRMTPDLLANEVWFAPDEPLSPRTPVSTCVARVTEYMFNDKELAGEPWRSSARYSHTDVFYDFGAEIDFLVSDKRSYSFMLKYVMSEVWNTSIRTKDAIVFEEPERIKYNSRITHVYWDPQGKKDVTIVYCVTKKEGQHKYPCIDQQRYTERAKNFISTLTVGSLRKSLECERAIVWNTTMNAKQCATAVVFTPPLYKQKKLQTTLDHVKMGTLTKIYIQFKQRFWSDGVETFLTPFNSSGYTCDAAPLIYNYDGARDLKDSRTLAIAVTGQRGREISDLAYTSDESTLREWTCQEFLPLFNLHFRNEIATMKEEELSLDCDDADKSDLDCALTCEDIETIFIPTWYNDDLSYGCWSIVPLGSSEADLSFEFGRMGNMILSGEGTCERQKGWVTGGFYSGERSARIMLKERHKRDFGDLHTKTLCDYQRSEFTFNPETCTMMAK